jgi:hypothetical protein
MGARHVPPARRRWGVSVSGGDHNPNPSAHDHKQNPRDARTSGGVTDYQGVDMTQDTEADEFWPVRDRQGDVWTLNPDDGLMHTPETRPFPREYVEKKWGPLLPAGDAGVSR